MVMTIKITVFWDVMPCSLIKFIRLYGIMPPDNSNVRAYIL